MVFFSRIRNVDAVFVTVGCDFHSHVQPQNERFYHFRRFVKLATIIQLKKHFSASRKQSV